MDQFYFEEGYFEQGYFVYTADAESLLTSDLSVSATASVIKNSEIDLASQSEFATIPTRLFELTADLGALFTPNIIAVARKNSTAILDTKATLTATVSPLRDNDAALNNIVNLSLQAARFASFASIQDSAFAQQSAPNRLRDYGADFVSTASFSATASKFTNYESLLAALVNLSLQGDRTRASNVSINAEFVQSTDVSITRSSDVSLAVNTQVSADTSITRTSNVSLAVNSGISTDVSRTRSSDVSLAVNTQVSADTSITRTSDVSLAVNSGISALVSITRSSNVSLNSSLTTAININRIKNAVVSATNYTEENYFEQEYVESKGVSITLSVTAGKLVEVEADLGALFTPNITAVARKNMTAIVDSTADLIATASKFTNYESLLAALVNLSLQGDRTRAALAALNTEFDQTTAIARSRNTESDLAISFDIIANLTGLQMADAALNSEFAISVDGGKVKEGDSSLNSDADVVARPISFVSKWIDDPRPFTWTLNSADYSTRIAPKHGSASLRLNTQFSFARTEPLPNEYYDIGIGEDFIFESWIYEDGATQNNLQAVFVSAGQTGGLNDLRLYSNAYQWAIGRSFNDSYLIAKFTVNGGSIFTLESAANTWSRNTWNHVVFRRINGIVQLILNGSVVDSVSNNDKFSLTTTDTNKVIRLEHSLTIGTYQDMFFDSTAYRIGDATITGGPNGPAVSSAEYSVFTNQWDGNSNDSLVLSAQLSGDATVTSTASILAVPNFTVNGITIHQSSGTLTAEADAILGGIANLTSESALNAIVEKPVDFAATITANTTVSATAGVIKQFNSDQTATATVETTATRILQFDTEFDSIAIQLASVAKIGQGLVTSEIKSQVFAVGEKTTGYSATLTANSTTSSVIFRIKSLSAQLALQSTIVADSNRLGDLRAIFGGEFEISVDGAAVRGATVNVQSEFTQIADAAGGFIGGSADLSVNTNISVDIDRIRNADLAVNTNANFSVSAIKAVEAVAIVDSQFTQTTDNSRTRTADTEFDSIATNIIAAAKIGDFLVTAESVASLTLNATVTAGVGAIIDAVSSQSTAATRTRPFDSVSTASFGIVINATASTDATGNFGATTALSAAAIKTITASADLGALFAPNITAVAQREGEILANITSTLDAQGARTRDTEASYATSATVDVLAGITVSADAELNTAFTVSADGKLIVLLLSQTYTVPREDRTHSIHRESRSYTIPRENRTYTIRG